MKRILLMSLLLIVGTACRPEHSKLTPDETLLLYPEGQLSGKGLTAAGAPLESNGITDAEGIDPDNGNLWNVGDKARIDLYFPEHPNGQMVIICPGGGYVVVSTENEGSYAAEWLTARGITAAVVKYRLPNGHDRIPLTDVQNTFRYCRAHAEEWGIRQIGIMGFSAGGHLAATACNFSTCDELRPDFAVLLYPVITFENGITHQGSRDYLLGNGHCPEEEDALVDLYSMEKQVRPTTPPTFIALCSDDRIVPVENSLRYYKALQQQEIPVEMHIFPTGDHGWGFRQKDHAGNPCDGLGDARTGFSVLLDRWLEAQKRNCIK